MSKAKAFKKWCAERQGHPPQIKLALEAILELEESNNDLNTSAFGDGWYDGFLEAKKLNSEDKHFLDDVEEDDVLDMSEHAEDKYATSKRKNHYPKESKDT